MVEFHGELGAFLPAPFPLSSPGLGRGSKEEKALARASNVPGLYVLRMVRASPCDSDYLEAVKENSVANSIMRLIRSVFSKHGG